MNEDVYKMLNAQKLISFEKVVAFFSRKSGANNVPSVIIISNMNTQSEKCRRGNASQIQILRE